jgi:hypothetical protein
MDIEAIGPSLARGATGRDKRFEASQPGSSEAFPVTSPPLHLLLGPAIVVLQYKVGCIDRMCTFDDNKSVAWEETDLGNRLAAKELTFCEEDALTRR